MDEVVEGVPRGIVVQVLLQQRASLVARRGPGLREAGLPFAGDVLEDLPDGAIVEVLLLVRVRAVLEVHVEFAVSLLDGVFLPEHEAAFLAACGLVVVAPGGSGDEIKVNVPYTLQLEAVVAEVLGGLDVVLVGVGPVELDLLALVRDGIDARLVAAQAEEIAVLVVRRKNV